MKKSFQLNFLWFQQPQTTFSKSPIPDLLTQAPQVSGVGLDGFLLVGEYRIHIYIQMAVWRSCPSSRTWYWKGVLYIVVECVRPMASHRTKPEARGKERKVRSVNRRTEQQGEKGVLLLEGKDLDTGEGLPINPVPSWLPNWPKETQTSKLRATPLTPQLAPWPPSPRCSCFWLCVFWAACSYLPAFKHSASHPITIHKQLPNNTTHSSLIKKKFHKPTWFGTYDPPTMPLCWLSRLNGRKGTTILAEIILQVIRYKDSLKRTVEDTSNPEGDRNHKSRRQMSWCRIRIGPGLSDVLIVRWRLRSLEFLTSVWWILALRVLQKYIV